jgi:hypothetical protein
MNIIIRGEEVIPWTADYACFCVIPIHVFIWMHCHLYTSRPGTLKCFNKFILELSPYLSTEAAVYH